MDDSQERSPRTWILVALGGSLALVTIAMIGWFEAGAPDSAAMPTATAHPRYEGPPKVWAMDDGTRIGGTDGAHPAMAGSAAWSPRDGLRLFALPGETVAFQVIVSAGAERLEGVAVGLSELAGPDGYALRRGDGPFSAIERFVSYELAMARRSGGAKARESLGWSAAAAPPGPPPGGSIPDPLVPVRLADHPAASRGELPWDYPMTVPAGQHRVVWVDVTFPDDAPAGIYRGVVEATVVEARIPVTIEVGAVRLPYRALRNMLYFEPEDVERRAGAAAIEHYLKLIHRHHLSTIVTLRSVEDVQRHRRLMDGSLFTEAEGYSGPGAGVASDVAIIGCYGALGLPDDEKLAAVEAMLIELEALGLRDDPGAVDVFLYAVDEQCDSPRGPAWRRALDTSDSPRLRSLRVGHTCSRPPAGQPVDLVMMFAPQYQPALAEAGLAADKRVWIYNGTLPRTGTFLSDGWPISLRANAWIQAHHQIERWFYWESTFWDDDNRGGKGPYDPWATAETFHNQDGDHCNGDGVLVYPGGQKEPGRLDLGFEGVVASMRLKQWRRGIQDGGYLELARARDESATRAISARLVGESFTATERPAFPTEGAPWLQARRELFAIITR